MMTIFLNTFREPTEMTYHIMLATAFYKKYDDLNERNFEHGKVEIHFHAIIDMLKRIRMDYETIWKPCLSWMLKRDGATYFHDAVSTSEYNIFVYSVISETAEP